MLIVGLVLSLVALFFAEYIFTTFPNDEFYQEIAWVILLFGFLGVAISTYILLQARRRLAKLRIIIPPVTTTIECKKCGFKSIREFQRGDFIFKELEKCQKCDDVMMITAIYREVEDKGKESQKLRF